MIRFRSDIAVALGGNMPFGAVSTLETLVAATEMLAASGLAIRGVSRFFTTPCFPKGAGPDYVNAVLCARTTLNPGAVLDVLQQIEHRFGRARVERWGQRTLDLDLLFHGDSVLPDAAIQQRWVTMAPSEQAKSTPQTLILPHPRLADRAFVLGPLMDVAPTWVHPVTGQSTAQMFYALPEDERRDIRPL
ncbi:MAG: 2-amino-4-hydroxy-6-hydroxymethyldihydropteridine diphosphokinase [Sedimentitalea sp.]